MASSAGLVPGNKTAVVTLAERGAHRAALAGHPLCPVRWPPSLRHDRYSTSHLAEARSHTQAQPKSPANPVHQVPVGPDLRAKLGLESRCVSTRPDRPVIEMAAIAAQPTPMIGAGFESTLRPCASLRRRPGAKALTIKGVTTSGPEPHWLGRVDRWIRSHG